MADFYLGDLLASLSHPFFDIRVDVKDMSMKSEGGHPIDCAHMIAGDRIVMSVTLLLVSRGHMSVWPTREDAEKAALNAATIEAKP